MPYARPTLTALRNQAVQDITTSGVPGLDGLLRNAVLRVLAWCMSGLAYSVYGYVDWIALESVPFTATDEYLEGWAALIGIYRKDSTPAAGSAAYSGQPGTVVAAGTAMMRGDGTPYTATVEVSVDSTGNVVVPFIAAVNGADTDCDAGVPMAIADPIGGINSGGFVVAPGATGGADQETDEALRTRALAKYRAPPQGGAIGDYQQWALEVPGVTRVFVQPNGMGAGTVIVRPMLDDVQAEYGGFPQGTDGCASEETRGPTAAGDQLSVAEHIWPVQPVTALVHVLAPVAHPIDVTLLALEPDTQDIRDQIVASINDMYLIKGQLGGTIFPSDLYEAILATPGLIHFTISEPALPVTVAAGELPIMGVLTVQNAALE
jgi:uncharacterized phage protein gp47/JayE